MRSRSPLPSALVLLTLLSIETSPRVSIFPRSRHSRPSVLVSAALTTITVDDVSEQITYSPADAWHSSSNPCSTCLSPGSDLAYLGTWHDGTHIIPTIDTDDLSNSPQDLQKGLPSASSSTTPPPAATSTKAASDDGDGDDDSGNGGNDNDNDKNNGKSKGKDKRKRESSGEGRIRRKLKQRTDPTSNPFFTPKLDSDDAGFVDEPVFAQFNFTGSAVNVFALVPLFPAAANSTPTFVNLTFTLDSAVVGSFNHSGSQSASAPSPTAYQSSVEVFGKSGLPEGSHSLTINVGPDSVFLLDFIKYSQDDGFSDGGNGTENTVSTTAPPSAASTLVGGAAGPNPTSSTKAAMKSHNVATFAGAVGGSVGLLAVLALSLAFSLYRRRLLAKRRDRRHRAARSSVTSFGGYSYHTEASEDGPPMQGPAPFVPRYFPGTIPVAPPPYVPSENTSDVTTALLSSASPVHTPLATVAWNPHRSGALLDADGLYADRPPPTPPPMEEGYFAPPPPFGVAIATPVPAILARFSNLLSSSSTSQSSSPTPPQQSQAQFQLPSSAPPSRRPSQSSVNRQSTTQGSTAPSTQPTDYSRIVTSQSSQSSLRRDGTNMNMSSSAQPVVYTTPPRNQSDSSSVAGSTRPPSFASEVPPSIPPPAEVIQAEREVREGRTRGVDDRDSASL